MLLRDLEDHPCSLMLNLLNKIFRFSDGKTHSNRNCIRLEGGKPSLLVKENSANCCKHIMCMFLKQKNQQFFKFEEKLITKIV